MRVLIVSKACIVGQYQSKLEALALQPDIELVAVVPPFWRDERGVVPLERLHTNGYRLVVAPARWNGRFHLHYYPTLPKIVEDLRPDVIHIDEEPYNLATFLAIRAARAEKAHTLFFTWQNLIRKYPPPFAWMERYVYAHSEYALAGNQEALQVLRAKGYAGPSKVIAQFGLDPTEFAPAARKDQAGPFRIGFVGRLVEEKGPHILLDALEYLRGTWRVEFWGSGPMQTQLESRVRSLGAEGRVSFGNWRPSAEMPSVYQNLDVLVVPSLTHPNWKEQFGRVVIEAMACQVPVITSNSGELPNVVGDAGIIVPENDPVTLANAMQELFSSPARRIQLGKWGRARVLERFTQKHIAAQTAAVYREILSMPHSLR